MASLTRRADEILRAEVEKCAGKDRLSQLEKKLVLEELEKLRSQKGSPATLEELRKIVITTYPHFSIKVLNKAALANRPAGLWGKIKTATVLTIGSIGALGVLGTVSHLPQATEQNTAEPVANNTPTPAAVTSPSLSAAETMSIDDNYARAIALVEQSDRLINQATTAADLVLGEQKLTQAKAHIDELPVTYESTEPYYTRRGRLRYRQTTVYSDQFASLRSKFEQMQAQIFQEKQAKTLLNQGEQALKTAKQQYQQAKTSASRAVAIASWQAALDRLAQIPTETWAGKTAAEKLTAYQRDFEQSENLTDSIERTGKVIQAAKQFALQAAKLGQNPPHLAAKWRQIENQWEEAISRLQQIRVQDPNYINAQKLLATYKTNLGIVQTRRQAEEASVYALEQAKDLVKSWIANTPTNNSVWEQNRTISQLQGIIYQLQKVKAGTTAYQEAQQLSNWAQQKLKQMQP